MITAHARAQRLVVVTAFEREIPVTKATDFLPVAASSNPGLERVKGLREKEHEEAEA